MVTRMFTSCACQQQKNVNIIYVSIAPLQWKWNCPRITDEKKKKHEYLKGIFHHISKCKTKIITIHNANFCVASKPPDEATNHDDGHGGGHRWLTIADVRSTAQDVYFHLLRHNHALLLNAQVITTSVDYVHVATSNRLLLSKDKSDIDFKLRNSTDAIYLRGDLTQWTCHTLHNRRHGYA